MKVVNTAGFTFTFEKNDQKITIPYDGRVYNIPDECVNDKFFGMLKIVVPPQPVNNIVEIKFDEELVDEKKDKVSEPQEESKPKKTPTKNKSKITKEQPLKGKRVKKPRLSVKRARKKRAEGSR